MTDYAELHCHSHYSFADGADAPAALAAEAARLGLTGLAITDHDGLYAAPQFDKAASEHRIPTVFGAELNLDLTRSRRGQVDPGGRHLVVLARDPDGYRALSRAITAAKLAGGEKDLPRYRLAELGAHADGGWQVLTGCRKGFLNAALDSGGLDAAEAALRELADAFGPEHLAVELTCHDLPGDTERIETLARLARRFALPIVATNNVHYAAPARARTAAALAAVRARSTLEATDPYLPANAGAHLRSGDEMAQRFADFPAAVEASARIAAECAFPIKLLAPRLPHFPVPN